MVHSPQLVARKKKLARSKELRRSMKVFEPDGKHFRAITNERAG